MYSCGVLEFLDRFLSGVGGKQERAVCVIYLNVSHHIPQFKSLHFYNPFRGVLFSDYMLSIQYILSYKTDTVTNCDLCTAYFPQIDLRLRA